MKKKQKRVSFSLPVQEEERIASEPAVHVSVNEEESFDDEVETADRDSSDELESESDGESSDGEAVNGNGEEGDEKVMFSETAFKATDEQDDDEDRSDPEGKGAGDREGPQYAKNGSESDAGSISDSSSDPESQSDDEKGNTNPTGEKAPPPVQTFGEMSLDPRIERAIERMGWRKPTPVQSAVIPAALNGRDVLVSAPTGSGKTAAYAIPIMHHICRRRSGESGVRAVVLVPTRELVHQVAFVFKALCKYVDGVHVAAVTGRQPGRSGKKRRGKNQKEDDDHDMTLSRAADVMVGTPASITGAAGGGEKSALTDVEFVVVDEADLVLSYGYENDARAALAKIPTTSQSMLLSATLEADGMDGFRKVVLRRPLTIKVTTDGDMQDGDPTGASHHFARLKNHKDRYLVAYVMLRLNVICGKVLIFVNHINSAFRLKLFLDQFKVKSAVLNSELPANSRMHCVEQFNAGVFDILIATDESKKDMPLSQEENGSLQKKSWKKSTRPEKDVEFGLSRGVDFRDVAAVLNFDVPENMPSYTHRAGRTARAGKSGTVLSLACNVKEEKTVREMGKDLGVHITPLAFRMDQIEAFRYRVEDCLRMVTDTAVNGARLADVRREIVNSEHLKDYFEDNPQDMDALQHNLSLAKKIPEHLAHIPPYLVPPALRGSVSTEPTGRKFRVKRRKGSGKRVTSAQRNADPLKSFTTNGVSGSSRQRYQAKHGIKRKKSDPGQTMRKRKRRNY